MINTVGIDVGTSAIKVAVVQSPEGGGRERPGAQIMASEMERVRRFDFVEDVRPLYETANVVIVPTLVSAGTNVKVLEAMAMERVVVSTPSGAGGLGLTHGESIWVAASAGEFAEGIVALLEDEGRRRRMAAEGRRIAVEKFGWEAMGEVQRALWEGL